MPKKKQKTISLPRKYYEGLEKLREENEDILEFLDITTIAELLRMMANFGRNKFLEHLEQARTLRMKKEESPQKQK